MVELVCDSYEELTPGSFVLTVKKVTDEKEDSSDKEEHVEDEK